MNEANNLKTELLSLFELIQKIRQEIASINAPHDHFNETKEQLNAIVASTAIATNEILDNAEKIGEVAEQLKESSANPDLINQLNDYTCNILISCSFQDISGQRISKVMKSLNHIESKINALVNIWGKDNIAQKKVESVEEIDEYKKFLNGPALPGQGLGQSDADAIIENYKTQKASIESNIEETKAAEVMEINPNSELVTEDANNLLNNEEKQSEDEKKEEGPALDQNAIDALFG